MARRTVYVRRFRHVAVAGERAEDLPQERIPGEGAPPPAPPVSVVVRKMQPSYWTGLAPEQPFTVSLSLDRDAHHVLVRCLEYTDYNPDLGFYNTFPFGVLRMFWGMRSSLGAEMMMGDSVSFDGVYLRNTLMLFQFVRDPAALSGEMIAEARVEVYYW